MQCHKLKSLWEMTNAGQFSRRFLADLDSQVRLEDLSNGSILGGRSGELQGRCILLATTDQLTTALALIELDGIAGRLILCPPGMLSEHMSSIMETAGVDAVISDRPLPEAEARGIECFICAPHIVAYPHEQRESRETDWILLTSGTSGFPKLVCHTLSSLAGAIKQCESPAVPIVWSTFYDIRRYGGLQIFLRALLDHGSLVLSNARESLNDFLIRAGANGVMRISGTPSHWRRVLMSPMARRISPHYIRLSGEIADQAILDNLRAFYPKAQISHAFASTEAGVAFDVDDGLVGFPARMVRRRGGDVEMKIENGSLRIRSGRVASRYLGGERDSIADAEGFVDTGDMVELRDDRYYFVGRRGGTINVGGQKVHPEDVEAVINRHPCVQMSLVKARRSSIMGQIVVADVVAKPGGCADASAHDMLTLEKQILDWCRGELAPYKVPAAIRFVPSIDVTASGKVARPSA
jgi:acyl-CoA synthetase (AMP-forming)/AMP-acid ligase II